MRAGTGRPVAQLERGIAPVTGGIDRAAAPREAVASGESGYSVVASMMSFDSD